MRNVSSAKVVRTLEAAESPLPAEIQEALGELRRRREGAIKDVFGEHALVHRCHRHKERNVCDLLPERDRPRVLPGSAGRGR